MKSTIATGVLAAALLAGCSGGDDGFAQDLEAVGVTPTPNLEEWTGKAREAFCGGTDDAFALSLTLKGVTRTHLEKERVVVEHLCPERVPMVDEALARL